MDKEIIREKLLAEIANTEASIEDYKEITKPVVPDSAIGRLSRMDAINNKSVAEASMRQAEHKLMNLKRVLNKLDTNEFGLCLNCKQPIPITRILFMPESLYCVNCS